MPKKVDEWHQMGTPTTPSQVNNFFDLCTKWLVGTPSSTKTIKFGNLNTYECDDKFDTEHFTFLESDININNKRVCFSCKGTTDVKMVISNPFTRKNQLFVCNNCFC
tara:strand:+ start:485 stop:805 length:321 start_codon:yes stop_codon:yes gene_type:complete